MKKDTSNTTENIRKRPPVVVVMGHIDHGKSTLLDYIRKTNIVDKEVGGITQSISAYEVEVPNKNETEKITFIDTPGHESFSGMRERGAHIADIAILIVSAEDGAKPQTIEAWKTIQTNNMPAIVAINKIDKPNANIEKTKIELAENEIYLENYGGKTPCAEISAKTGQGVDNLLSLISILAEMENFTGDTNKNASGFVLESNMDNRRGIQATLIIKDGSLKRGMTVVASGSSASTNIIENYKGQNVGEVSFSTPVRIVGFDKIPEIGNEFRSFTNKKDAEIFAKEWEKTHLTKFSNLNKIQDKNENHKKVIPLILKADIAGSIEAIEKDIKKLSVENAEFKIIHKGIGPVSESDIKNIGTGEEVIVLGFNVKTDKSVEELARKKNVTINNFNIIYKMTEWLTEEMEKRRPRIETIETTGKAKILKVFSHTKDRQVAGGKVLKGRMILDKNVKILRREFEIGRGKIINLEKAKTKVKEVEEGSEFGMLIESKIELVEGDTIESFNITQK